MKFKIKHEIKGRIRVRVIVKHMTVKEADLLEYALSNKEGITSVRVNERTADVVLCYKTDRATVLSYLRKCHIEEIEAPESYLAHSGRALNNEYWDKLVGTVVWRCTKKLFVPAPICTCITLAAAIPYIWKGVKTLVKGKLEVPVLDATAITISIARGDVSTASSVMFLLGIGEIDLNALGNSHIHDTALYRTLASQLLNLYCLANAYIFQCFHIDTPFRDRSSCIRIPDCNSA